MLPNIKSLGVVVYMGISIYKYLVDGNVWEYSLDSALDGNVRQLRAKGVGAAYNYVKTNGEAISKNGVSLDELDINN